MHWYDHFAIFCALVLALWADHDAGRALRAALIHHLAFVAAPPDGGWIRGADLRIVFGPSVYKHLRRLVDAEVLEKRVTPGGPERGGRDDHSYRYRWRVK